MLAEVEEIIARLRKLKDHERDTRLRGVYLASIERLEGLSYRLRKPETHVIGLPARQAAPPPARNRRNTRGRPLRSLCNAAARAPEYAANKQALIDRLVAEGERRFQMRYVSPSQCKQLG